MGRVTRVKVGYKVLPSVVLVVPILIINVNVSRPRLVTCKYLMLILFRQPLVGRSLEIILIHEIFN